MYYKCENLYIIRKTSNVIVHSSYQCTYIKVNFEINKPAKGERKISFYGRLYFTM